MSSLFSIRRILFFGFLPLFTFLSLFGGRHLLAAKNDTPSDSAILSELKNLNGQTSALEKEFDVIKAGEDTNMKDTKALKPWMASRPGRKKK